MTYCGICNEPTNSTRAAVIDGVYYADVCKDCASDGLRNPDSSAAEYHRQRQREDRAADILQSHVGGKVNMEFAKMYRDQWTLHYTPAEIEQIKKEI